MEIIENNKHTLTTFDNIEFGVVFKCGNDYFMKIPIVVDLNIRRDKYGIPTSDVYNAIHLNNGNPHHFKKCEEVVLVDCKLVVE